MSLLPNDGRPYLLIAVDQNNCIVTHAVACDSETALKLISVGRKAIKDQMSKIKYQAVKCQIVSGT